MNNGIEVFTENFADLIIHLLQIWGEYPTFTILLVMACVSLVPKIINRMVVYK